MSIEALGRDVYPDMILVTMIEFNKERPFQLGIVGAGKIAQIVLPMLQRRGIVAAAICDVNPGAASALAATCDGAKAVANPDEVAAHPSLDAVYLATPPATHHDLILKIASGGKPVICEKPWVLNAAEAKQLVEQLRSFPSVPVASCASRFRFTPAVKATMKFLEEGQLGRVRQVRINAVPPPLPPLSELPPWKRNSATAGGGVAADWCVYELDWLGSVFGASFNPIEVTATLDDWKREGTGMDSGYTVHIRCGSGLDVRLSRRAEIAPRRHLVEIRCENGGLDLPFAPDSPDRVARIHRLGKEGVQTEEFAQVENWEEILCGPIVNLAESVRNGLAVASDANSQILVHQVLDAIYASGRANQTIRLS